MLNKKYRATRTDIEKTIKNGFVVDSPLFYFKVSKENTEKISFAIVVSKKVEKTSVGRHLIKRRISGVLEKKIDKIRPDFKKIIVIFAKKTEKIPKYSEIKNFFEEMMSKIV